MATDVSSDTFCVAVATNIWIGRDFNETGESPAASIQQYSVPHPVTALACFRDMLAVGEASGHIRIFFYFDRQDKLRESSVINWHSSPVSSLHIASHGMPS